MILNKPGETFEYEGRKLMIGDQIIANGKSVYAIQRQNDEIAVLRGAKIEKTHKRKRYIFEVSRNRIGAADVYLNGELIANMLDEVVDAVEPENIQTDIVKGKGSTIPDAVFVKSVLYSPADSVCHLSDKVKAILDRDISKDIQKKLKENLARVNR